MQPIIIHPDPENNYLASRISAELGHDGDGYPITYSATLGEFLGDPPDMTKAGPLQTVLGYLLTHGEPIVRLIVDVAEMQPVTDPDTGEQTGESPVVSVALTQQRRSDGAGKTWVARQDDMGAEVAAAFVSLAGKVIAQ
jgi:hypothetical protein